MDTAERALASVDFDGNPPSPQFSHYLDKVADLEAASAEMVTVVATIGQFADRADQRDLLRRLLRRVASPADARLGGLTAWIDLRGYPTLLALYGLGLGATATDNWEVLASALGVTVNDPNRGDGTQVPVAARFSMWSVLEHDVIKSSFGSPGRKTPVSDHLHAYFGEVLRPRLRLTEDQFAVIFDEWEYLLGVVTADARGRGPIGRFVWKNHGFSGSPDRALVSASADLLAAGLFEGTADKLTSTRSEYDEVVSQSGLRF